MGSKRYVLFTMGIIIAAGMLGLLIKYSLTRNNTADRNTDHTVPARMAASNRISGFLYFADPKGVFLSAEERTLIHASDTVQLAKNIIFELLQGPRRELINPIPAGTKLAALYVDKEKTAYADFSNEIQTRHPGGCAAEMLTVYAIVNSLVLNIVNIDTVKILINGKEADTLAGHVDLSWPLKADLRIIR